MEKNYLINMWYFIRGSSVYWCIADNIITPLLRILNAELAHKLAVMIFKNHLGPIEITHSKDIDNFSNKLSTNLFGMYFSNPIGLAAGFDKQAEAIKGLFELGFGFIEIGGVTPKPQPGNPKPRLFFLPKDKAIINRYGLNSDGLVVVGKRLSNFKKQDTVKIVGINLAKNTDSLDAIADYLVGIKNLSQYADFIVLNISCPNVSWSNTLSENIKSIENIICLVKKSYDEFHLNIRRPPLLIKLSPDMNYDTKAFLARIVMQQGIDGLVVSNTTANFNNLKSKLQTEKGGLSGKPLKELAIQTLRDMYRLTSGKIPIIGVGGIESAKDAYARIRAGASLIQIYSALMYQGPGLLLKIKRELVTLLKKDGFNNISEAVGADIKL